jgi:hypothetical protein
MMAGALVRQRNEESRLFRAVVWRCRDSSLSGVSSGDQGYGVGVAPVSSGVAIVIGVAIPSGVAIVIGVVIAIGVAACIAVISIVGSATTPQA